MLVNRVQLFVVDNQNLQSFQNTAQLDMVLLFYSITQKKNFNCAFERNLALPCLNSLLVF